MGRYVRKNLLAGESIVCEARIHWCYWVQPVFTMLILIILACVSLWASKNIGEGDDKLFLKLLAALGFVVAAIVFLKRFIRYKTTEMVVTTRRLIYKKGFISRHTFELQLSKVETIGVDQNIIGRIFNFGTVSAIGTGGTGESIHFIARPMQFRNDFQKCVDSFNGQRP